MHPLQKFAQLTSAELQKRYFSQ